MDKSNTLAVSIGGDDRQDGLKNWARSVIGSGKQILEVYLPDKDAVDTVQNQASMGLALVCCCMLIFMSVPVVFFLSSGAFSSPSGPSPIFIIPFLFFLLPIGCCVVPGYYNSIAKLRSYVYVVCDDGVYMLLRDFTPPCCSFGCSTGNDYDYVPWANMISIQVESQGRGCLSLQSRGVKIVENGFHMTGSGNHRRIVQNHKVLYVSNPAGVAARLIELKNTYGFQPMTNAFSSALAQVSIPIAPAVSTMDERFRVFCATERNPNNAQLIMVSQSMGASEIAVLACAALGEKSMAPRVVLVKGSKRIPFSQGSDLKEDDEILLMP